MDKRIEALASKLGAEVVGSVPPISAGAFGVAKLAETLRARLEPSAGKRPGRPSSPAWSKRSKVPLMKRFQLPFVLLFACAAAGPPEVRDGDVVFHTSRSSQSLAIQRATDSPYSHMGLILHRDGEPFVFEAISTVQYTPLEQWIARGDGGHYVVKRLRGADRLLTSEALTRFRAAAGELEGRAYDLTFEWTDERLYCSELVWKLFERVLGLEVGALQKLETFDLSDPAVATKVRERYGDDVPEEEPVISPAAMFASPLLETVLEQ